MDVHWYHKRTEVIEPDYAHPERQFKQLVRFAAPGEPSSFPKEFEEQGWTRNMPPRDEEVELCRACGWTTYDQRFGYCPRIRIIHSRHNVGLWALGSNWLLRDEPNDGFNGNELMTWEFLIKQPNLTIPLVKEMRMLTEPADPIQFRLISRAQGKGLGSVWKTLSPEQKSSYRDQMVDILKQLRQFTAPFPQKVNGEKLDDHLLFMCFRHSPACFKMAFTEDEWLEDVSPALRDGLSRILETKDKKTVEERLQQMKANFPRGGPYVLTHGDLNLTNIIVRDDKIEAIIDWETAGYYPWWGETYVNRQYSDWDTDDFLEGGEGVWGRVHPDLDPKSETYKAMLRNVDLFQEAFNESRVHHKRPDVGFWVPPFCKCKPYGGRILPRNLGLRQEHTVFDWDKDYGTLLRC